MKGGGTYHGKNGLISGSSSVEWVQGSFVAQKQPLTWYKPIFDAPAGDEPLALDMNSMGKGQVWINGQSIGRYWPAYKATGGPCTTCNYTGYYDEKKCLSNCGKASQRWYHVPRSWLKPRGNLLVVFEELGGIPYGISLVKREIYSVCADIYEWQPSLKIYEMQASGKANKPLRPKAHLSCSPDQKISAVKFASFGTPQGGCGSFQQGSCHAHDSYDIFNKDIIHAMPHDAHPMGVLVSAISALSVFHPDANPALKSRCKPQHRSICSRTTPRRTASRTAHRQPHHQQALHLRFRQNEPVLVMCILHQKLLSMIEGYRSQYGKD